MWKLAPAAFITCVCISLFAVGCGGSGAGSVTAPQSFPSTAPSQIPPTLGQVPDGTVQTIAQSGQSGLDIAGEAWDPNTGYMFVTLRQYGGTNGILLVAPTGQVVTQEALPSANLSFNEYLVYDPADSNVYITYGTETLKVTSSGFVSSTFATGFENATGITYDSQDGNFYVADYDHVDRISPADVVTPITAPGTLGGGESGIAYDSHDGNLYVADPVQNEILQLTTNGAVAIYAGQCVKFPGQACENGDADGTGSAAQFAQPTDITYDADKDLLYVVDSANHQVRQIASGAVVTTIAGSGQSALIDGVGRQAAFEDPQNIGYDHANANLYVSDNLTYYRAVGTAGPVPPSPGPILGGFVMYPLPNVGAQPSGIAQGADGAMWFTEAMTQVGRITMDGQFSAFTLPSGCSGGGSITLGHDGDEYFTTGCQNPNNPFIPTIAKVTPGGVFTLYSFPILTPQPESLTQGDDGNVWFTLLDVKKKKFVGKITPAGQITEYSVSSQLHQIRGVYGLTFGPAHDLWVTDTTQTLDQIGIHGRLINAFPLPGQGGFGIAAGRDGDLWLTDPVGDDIKRVTPTGTVTTYPIGSAPSSITTGSDGNLYFTQYPGTLGFMTPSGSYGFVYVPAPSSAPNTVTLGPDGNIWFTDMGANMIGRYIINPNTKLPPGTKVLRPATHLERLPRWVPVSH